MKTKNQRLKRYVVISGGEVVKTSQTEMFCKNTLYKLNEGVLFRIPTKFVGQSLSVKEIVEKGVARTIRDEHGINGKFCQHFKKFVNAWKEKTLAQI